VLGEVIDREVAGGAEAGGVVAAFPIVIFRTAEAVCPLASVTAKVNALVPALTGVPDKTPELLKPRPVLQAPEQAVTAHVYGVVPPVAAREVL